MAILASPKFLYRVEELPQNAQPGPPTASATSSWPRGCPSSSGARDRMMSC
jgi:hypothetical protein